jgi:SpoVK/Ycf46/Vps4 family AAA+-type ATPase
MIYHLASAHPLLWVSTIDYNRISNQIADEVKEHLHRQVFRWDISTGIVDMSTGKVVEESNGMPQQPIEFLTKQKRNCVMLALDYHRHITDIEVWRPLLNAFDDLRFSNNAFVGIAALCDLPSEIERYITCVDMPLPSFDELFTFAQSFRRIRSLEATHSDEELNELASQALGMTLFEFESALSLSYTKFKQLRLESVQQTRQQLIKKNGLLDIYHSNEGFEAVIGLDRLKTFAKTMIESGQGRGILILGVPGTAKSHFAKCLGKESGRPTVVFDPGRQMGSLVGDTERRTREALKTIDAQGKCIVFIDEIEKALSGSNSSTNDTAVRQFGTILQWMNDRSSDSYIIATANDISSLPAAFLRAERWDAIFFVDLPTADESDELLSHFCQMYQLPPSFITLEDYTGAEIKSLCRTASALSISLSEAKTFITPISITAKEQIESLRTWAKTRCVPASTHKNGGKTA